MRTSGDEPKRNLSTADLAEAARRSSEMPPDVDEVEEEPELAGGALSARDERRVRASEDVASIDPRPSSATPPGGTSIAAPPPSASPGAAAPGC